MRLTRLVSDPEVERKRWEHCTRCHLGTTSFRRVWGEGTLPCDLLVIGEAPGASEDAIGRPFIGPSGAVLREAIAQACAGSDDPLRVFLTNLVACVPYQGAEGGRVRPPTGGEVVSCAPRLQWICSHSGAQRVLLLGATAGAYHQSVIAWTPHAEISLMEHPAYALRRGGTAKATWVQEVKRWINSAHRSA